MTDVNRRRFLFSAAAAALTAPISTAQAAPASDIQARRLANRLELWASFARRTNTLVARYSTRRESSLLHEPLIVTGSLGFAAPGTLVMRDDDLSGSTTKIGVDDTPYAITPNQSSVPSGPIIDPEALPALRWLGDHLVALFAPGDGDALIANARTLVPRGRSPRLEILPPLDSETRKRLRSVTVTLDPVGGAVLVVDITEAQGDRITVRISDHRQNPDPSELDRVLKDPERG